MSHTATKWQLYYLTKCERNVPVCLSSQAGLFNTKLVNPSLLAQLLDVLQVQKALLAPPRLPCLDLGPEFRVQVVSLLRQLIRIAV
jgi:hypothetical protein